jgi:hypothetical protein
MFYGWQNYENSAQYIHVDDLTWGLVFTAGACLDSREADPRAGWAFVANPPELEGLATRMAMSKAVSRNTFLKTMAPTLSIGQSYVLRLPPLDVEIGVARD